MIDKLYKNAQKRYTEEPKRDYLGFSEIGHKCMRYLWLSYHHGYLKAAPPPRICRILENGKVVEKKIIKELRQAGIPVLQTQLEFSLLDGRFKGHWDGLIKHEGVKKCLEIKGVKSSTWKKFVSKGIEETEPKYYHQGIMYSGCASLGSTLFIIENKDTQELYQEEVFFNQNVFDFNIDKAKLITSAMFPPHGISNRIDWWECKMCEMNNNVACRKQWDKEFSF